MLLWLNMKRTPYTAKDFAWVNMTAKQIEKYAIEALTKKKENYFKIKSILPEKRTYENTVYAITVSDGGYGDIFHQMGLLNVVSPKKEIREKIHIVLTSVSQKLVDIEYDKGLYTALIEYHEGNFASEKKKLTKEDIKLLTEMMRDYKRMGFDLPVTKQRELKKLLKLSSKLSHQFRKNIDDYEDFILCSKEELTGLSERFISGLPFDEKLNKYKVTLQYPHLYPFLAESKNRDKRKELSLKSLQKGGKNNLKVIQDLVVLRKKIATILGYKHHADFVTADRMAKSGEQAASFQESLLKKLAPLAKNDMETLRAHAKTLGIKKLEHYDTSYVATQLKKSLFDLDPETLRGYFPLEHVRNEMFKLFQELFGLSIKEVEMKLWHKDVKLFQVLDSARGRSAASGKNSLIGYFAMDLFPREGKFGHAAMFDVIVGREKTLHGTEYVAPLSSMVCNFPVPSKFNSKKIPSLLSIGEVETLFHEFGHCMHMTLSTSRHESQAGANVAWDFVETPSQIMEFWVWNKEMLSKLSKHYKDGKKLPNSMIDRILSGKTFQNANMYTRQLIMGKLDLDLHTGKVKDASKAYRDMNKKYFAIDLPIKETLFPAGFGHLVGYDAGYYSYLWALVYAADAYSEFEKNGIMDKEIGLRWRREVLEKGSSNDEMKLIKNFLRRSPNQKAFLKEVIG